jgi:hypothetical protein
MRPPLARLTAYHDADDGIPFLCPLRARAWRLRTATLAALASLAEHSLDTESCHSAATRGVEVEGAPV